MSDIAMKLHRAQRILEISHEMTSTVSLEALLGKIVEASVELTECASAGILLLNAKKSELCFTTASDSAGELIGIPVPIDGSIAGHVFSTGEPLTVADVRTDPRYYAAVEKQVGIEAYSLLAVPLQFKGRRIGVLEVENKQQGAQFDEEDVETLVALAAHATVAIENARLYQQLERHRDHLKELVAERTVELHNVVTEATALNKQLAWEIEERETLIEDLEAFSYMVAHDLKSPLGLVVGYSEVLLKALEEKEDTELVKFVDPIHRTGNRMTRIINGILTLARIRQQDVILQPVDMASILGEVEERLAPEIMRSQAQISKPLKWPTALGHTPWIEEIWANYISNAIKYGNTPPCIELGFDYVPSSGDSQDEDQYIRFWIHDDGPGVSLEIQARLFTKFARFDKTRAQGHGLGLSIVKRITEKLGGQVGVESVNGEGSLFFFTLPTVSKDRVSLMTPELRTLAQCVDAEQTHQEKSLPELLVAVAPDVLVALRRCVAEGDVEAIQSVIIQISIRHPVIAKTLDNLAYDFDYDGILSLIDQALAQP